MSDNSQSNKRITIPDEYPPRPSTMLTNEIHRLNSKIEKQETCTLILLSVIYFVFGLGLSLYAPLYPPQAKSHGVPIFLFGPVIAINMLSSIIFFPVATRMVTSITCRQSSCMSMFIIGICKILFGVIALIPRKLSFILMSYAIQLVEGIGISLLIASTFLTVFSQVTENTSKNIRQIISFFVLALCTGPTIGEAVFQSLGFSNLFYGTGVLTVICSILFVTLLPEPESTSLRSSDLSILSWGRKPRMIIYCFIVFTTLNFAGFLSVILETYLRQLHLDKLFIGMLFSVPVLVSGISALVWRWFIKKGMNSVLLICIASIFIVAALLLFDPAPFFNLDVTLGNIAGSLVLSGIGTGGKLMCVKLSADRDLISKQSSDVEADLLIIPTLFVFGSSLGFLSGSIIAGFTYFYLGIQKAVYILLGCESVSVVVSFVFAFRRNYRSPRFPEKLDEQKPILESQE